MVVEWLNSMVFHGGDIVVAIALALSVGFIAGAGFAEWGNYAAMTLRLLRSILRRIASLWRRSGATQGQKAPTQCPCQHSRKARCR